MWQEEEGKQVDAKCGTINHFLKYGGEKRGRLEKEKSERKKERKKHSHK